MLFARAASARRAAGSPTPRRLVRLPTPGVVEYASRVAIEPPTTGAGPSTAPASLVEAAVLTAPIPAIVEAWLLIHAAWGTAAAIRGVRSNAAARNRQIRKNEQPLVVAGLAAIRSQGVLFALADHPRDSADRNLTALRLIERRRPEAELAAWRVGAAAGRRGLLSAPTVLCSARRRLSRRRLSGTGLTKVRPRRARPVSRTGLPRGNRAHCRHERKFPILCHGVLVLLAKIAAFDQCFNAGRIDVPGLLILPTVEGDSAGVLFAPEHELGFLLSTRFLTPDRHRDRHQDGHNGQRYQQGRHRVTPLAARTRALTS